MKVFEYYAKLNCEVYTLIICFVAIWTLGLVILSARALLVFLMHCVFLLNYVMKIFPSNQRKRMRPPESCTGYVTQLCT